LSISEAYEELFMPLPAWLALPVAAAISSSWLALLVLGVAGLSYLLSLALLF